MQRQNSTEGSLSQRQPSFVQEKPSKRMFSHVNRPELVTLVQLNSKVLNGPIKLMFYRLFNLFLNAYILP